MSENTQVVEKKNSLQQVFDITKAIAICTKEGELRMIKRSIPLSIADGTLVEIPGTGQVACSAQGYIRQASGCGLQVFAAPCVLVDGREQPNPYPFRDENGRIIGVWSRHVCIGYTELGVKAVSDATCYFDIFTYKRVDMMAKVQSCKSAFKWVPKGTPVSDGWAVYPYDEATEVHVNLAHEDAIKWQKAQENRIKKAMETAQTFSRRNAIKAHPMVRFHAMPKSQGSKMLVSCLACGGLDSNISIDPSEFADPNTSFKRWLSQPEAEEKVIRTVSTAFEEEADFVDVGGEDEDTVALTPETSEPQADRTEAERKDDLIEQLIDVRDNENEAHIFNEVAAELEVAEKKLYDLSEVTLHHFFNRVSEKLKGEE